MLARNLHCRLAHARKARPGDCASSVVIVPAAVARFSDRWLLDVSRIQARLGELRTVYAIRKGGIYAAIAAAIIGSGPLHLPFVFGSLLCSGVAHGIYRRRLPPPY